MAVVFQCAARELAPAWEPNYQVSVDNHAVPPVRKTAHTEHPSITFCPTVLTSVIMKSTGTITLELERIVKYGERVHISQACRFY